MSNNKNKYLIFPEHTYILEYDGFNAEIQGKEILDKFYRSVLLDKLIEETYRETKQDDDRV